MRIRIAGVGWIVVACALALGQATKPGSGLDATAAEAYSAGRYAVALPMLQQLATKYKDQADKEGPIQDEIKVCQAKIAAMANTAAPQQGPVVVTAADKRVVHVKPKDGDVAEMGIKDLGNFEYDAEHGGNIPKDVMDLSGSEIRLKGFMIPMDQADRITRFALVPSLFACCFGQPPQIQHTIIVQCPEGKAVSYFPDEIKVQGKLKVEEKKEDGFIVSIFEMGAESVKPAGQ